MLKIKVWVLEKHTYQYHNQQGSSVFSFICYPSISISTIHTSIAYLHIHTSILHGSALSASKSYVRSAVWSKYLWVYFSCHWTFFMIVFSDLTKFYLYKKKICQKKIQIFSSIGVLHYAVIIISETSFTRTQKVLISSKNANSVQKVSIKFGYLVHGRVR